MRREMDGLKAVVEKTLAAVESMGSRFDQVDLRLDKMDAKLDRTIVTVAQLAGKVHEMDGRMSGLESRMVTRDEFNTRMDGFAGLLLDSRQRWAIHADTLAEHDKRLTKLEHPTA